MAQERIHIPAYYSRSRPFEDETDSELVEGTYRLRTVLGRVMLMETENQALLCKIGLEKYRRKKKAVIRLIYACYAEMAYRVDNHLITNVFYEEDFKAFLTMEPWEKIYD